MTKEFTKEVAAAGKNFTYEGMEAHKNWGC